MSYRPIFVVTPTAYAAINLGITLGSVPKVHMPLQLILGQVPVTTFGTLMMVNHRFPELTMC